MLSFSFFKLHIIIGTCLFFLTIYVTAARLQDTFARLQIYIGLSVALVKIFTILLLESMIGSPMYFLIAQFLNGF